MRIFVGLFVFLGLTLSSSSNASEADNALADLVRGTGVRAEDPFTQLVTLFDAGDTSAASAEELRPWWTGRCFAVDKKTTPLASVIFTTLENDAGPLLPGAADYRMRVGLSYSPPATTYDSMSPGEKKAQEDVHAEEKAKTSKAKVVNGSLTVSVFSSTPLVRRVRKVVRDGRAYYVSRVAVAIDVTSEGVQYKEGDDWWACYYFAKVDFSKPEPTPPVTPVTPAPTPVSTVCECMCRAWIPAPVPTVGGYLRYEYGYSHLATRTSSGYSLRYRFDGHTADSCSRLAGSTCAGTDNSQQGWPHFVGNLNRCELARW